MSSYPIRATSSGTRNPWVVNAYSIERITAELEEVLTPFQMRPHSGKLFHMNAATIAPLYERHSDFVRLQERLDPRGAFRNQWLRSHVLGNT